MLAEKRAAKERAIELAQAAKERKDEIEANRAALIAAEEKRTRDNRVDAAFASVYQNASGLHGGQELPPELLDPFTVSHPEGVAAIKGLFNTVAPPVAAPPPPPPILPGLRTAFNDITGRNGQTSGLFSPVEKPANTDMMGAAFTPTTTQPGKAGYYRKRNDADVERERQAKADERLAAVDAREQQRLTYEMGAEGRLKDAEKRQQDWVIATEKRAATMTPAKLADKKAEFAADFVSHGAAVAEARRQAQISVLRAQVAAGGLTTTQYDAKIEELDQVYTASTIGLAKEGAEWAERILAQRAADVNSPTGSAPYIRSKAETLVDAKEKAWLQVRLELPRKGLIGSELEEIKKYFDARVKNVNDPAELADVVNVTLQRFKLGEYTPELPKVSVKPPERHRPSGSAPPLRTAPTWEPPSATPTLPNMRMGRSGKPVR
jgi:hypothetical protein